MIVRTSADGSVERQPATPQAVLEPGWQIVVIGSRAALEALGTASAT